MSIPNISNVFAELNHRFRKSGMNILGGFSPYLFDNTPSSSFNFIRKDNTILSSSGGISNDEAFFMHGLCEQILPKNILIIGNSYGFSTVFLALSNPDAKLLAFDKYRTEGIKVTNTLLKGLQNKLVVQGSTPDDIIPLINNHFQNKKLDFVLIDAVHTNDMQTKEFNILKNYLSDDSVVVFHDVISCNLLDSYNYLKEDNQNLTFRLINKTASGIGVCLKGKLSDEMNSFLDYFSSTEEEIFNFFTLLSKEKTLSTQNLFKDVRTNLNFPPHPQK